MRSLKQKATARFSLSKTTARTILCNMQQPTNPTFSPTEENSCGDSRVEAQIASALATYSLAQTGLPKENFPTIKRRLDLEETPSESPDVVGVFEVEGGLYMEAHVPKEQQNVPGPRRGTANVTFSIGGMEETYGHPMDPPDAEYRCVVSMARSPIDAMIDLQSYYRRQAIGEFLMAEQEKENDLSLAGANHEISPTTKQPQAYK